MEEIRTYLVKEAVKKVEKLPRAGVKMGMV